MEKVTIPEGTSGSWFVERFEINQHQSAMSVFSYGSRSPAPGIYTALRYNGMTIMSDTHAEMQDHRVPVFAATGHILINGLGIGLVLFNAMMKDSVERATVIEISPDVIKLVGPYYQDLYGDRLEIIEADALEYKPPKGIRYGMVWHDIWPSISSDNHEEMKKLHRRYGRRADWQGSWCRRKVESLVREDKRRERERDFFRSAIGGNLKGFNL